jgi:hypothetical protein
LSRNQKANRSVVGDEAFGSKSLQRVILIQYPFPPENWEILGCPPAQKDSNPERKKLARGTLGKLSSWKNVPYLMKAP